MSEMIMLAGILFCFFGCIGIVKLPDVHLRLQAGVKTVTFGIFLFLIGILIKEGFNSMGIRSLLCALFIWFITPVIGSALAKVIRK